ncbi:MAG: hypothetical protein H0W49_07470 [Nitrospirales bacterium]|nr:hypothetical protein [Nitrospirales bacterium]
MSQKLSVADIARTTGLPSGDITALERQGRPSDRTEVRASAKVLDSSWAVGADYL